MSKKSKSWKKAVEPKVVTQDSLEKAFETLGELKSQAVETEKAEAIAVIQGETDAVEVALAFLKADKKVWKATEKMGKLEDKAAEVFAIAEDAKAEIAKLDMRNADILRIMTPKQRELINLKEGLKEDLLANPAITKQRATWLTKFAEKLEAAVEVGIKAKPRALELQEELRNLVAEAEAVRIAKENAMRIEKENRAAFDRFTMEAADVLASIKA